MFRLIDRNHSIDAMHDAIVCQDIGDDHFGVLYRHLMAPIRFDIQCLTREGTHFA